MMWNWISQHQFGIGVVAMYLFSAVTQAMPQPQEGKSSGWYLFLFNLIHALAANFGNLRLSGFATAPKLEGAKNAGPGFVALALAALLALGSGVACKSSAYKTHPGAVDVFDSQSYDALLVAQATLQQAKGAAQAGTLPAAGVAPLNDAIKAYDVAEAAWQGYHASGSSAAAQSALQNALAAMTSALAELQKVVPAVAASPSVAPTASPVPASTSTQPNGGKQ